MIVVSNTSPIINLAAIGQLDLLRHLYGTIIIPQAVYHEIAVSGAGQPGASEIQTSPWFERQHVRGTILLKRLEQHLDAGEAEAIAMTIEMRANLLLIDERRGRLIARQHGLVVMGLLGTLLAAKQHGYLMAMRPVLYDLMTKAGFWIDPDLFNQILTIAGES
jgi:predicted nucleic acid-binding protein